MTQSHHTSPSPLEQMRRRHRVGVVRTARKADTSRRLSIEDERLLNQVLQKEQDFIDSEAFYEPDAEKRIYQDAPPIEKPDVRRWLPSSSDTFKSHAALISARWVNACGKLPRWRPVSGSISSP